MFPASAVQTSLLLFTLSAMALLADADAQTAEVTEAENAATAAAPTEAPLPQTGGAIALSFGQPRSIAEEISMELIDLKALEEAVDMETGGETLRMSLEEAIAYALSRNESILVAAVDPEIAASDVFAAKGQFDPFWQTQANYLEASQSLSQQFVAFGGITSSEIWQTTINSSVGGKLQTGTLWNVAFALTKEETTFGGFIEDFSTSLTLSLTQPLLRGRGLKYNRIRLRQAETAVNISEAQLRLTVMQAVSEVIKAYWDLVGAIEAVKVREGSLANAERLLQISQTQREIGTAADLAVLQAKAGVSTRQSDLIAARSLVMDAGDRLKQVLGMKSDGRLSRVMIIPSDRPNPAPFDIEILKDRENAERRSIALALEKRPEIEIAEYQIAIAEMDVARTRHEMMPQLDITGSVTQGGRDHKLRQSLYGIRDRVDTATTIGIQATIPLGNRAARGQHERALLQAHQSELRRAQTETGIEAQVRLALRQAATNQILIESTQNAVRLQEATVNAEETKLRLGTSTSWQVLQVQEELTMAQTQKLQSQIQYEKALIDLQMAEGTLLENLGIEFDPVDSGVQRPGYFGSILPRR